MQILLLLIVVALIVFLVVNRKRGSSGATAQPTPAAPMEAATPSEQYGPSVDEVAHEEPSVDADPEPVVEIEPEPVLEMEPEPVVEIVREPSVEMPPEPVVDVAPPVVAMQPEPVVDVAPPVVAMQPEPFAAQAVIEAEPTVDPEPVAELQHESVIEVVHVEPEPVADVAPEPVVDVAPADPQPVSEPAAEVAPEAAVETQTESEPVLEISYPDMPTEDAPPGLSLDAFKDIKPVAFGGVGVEETEPASPAEPETGPVVTPEPVVEIEPEPVVEIEPEPVVEIEPEPAFEPLSYPVDSEPEIEPGPELPVAAAVAEPAVADEPKPKKRGFRLPNPEIKLPSFGKKQKAAPAVTAEEKPKAKDKTKGGLKLPQITLPPNLQGALTDVERKIVLGSIVAIVAAGAFGYATAPTEDAAAPAPTPAPATPTP